jgi:hypothetical protein
MMDLSHSLSLSPESKFFEEPEELGKGGKMMGSLTNLLQMVRTLAVVFRMQNQRRSCCVGWS